MNEPALRPHAGVEAPYLVAFNLTRRCNLNCAHCYLDAGTRASGDSAELDTAEVTRLIDQVATLSTRAFIVLTGGEPLLRPDLPVLARHAAERGLMVVVGTNGTLLTARRLEVLQAAGVRALGISLDSLSADYHDRFRGMSGAWEKAMMAIEVCRRAGMMFQIHFSVTDENAGELDRMIAFAATAGAAVLNVFFLVCTGRGETFTNVSPAVYEGVLARVAEAAAEEASILVRARCAPHFQRIALERRSATGTAASAPSEAVGCLAGKRYCRITPEGTLTPCPYMDIAAGTLRERSFGELWQGSALFARLRAPALSGRCGICEYRELCGGCRARPLARHADLMGEDFLCEYLPRGGEVIRFDRAPAAETAWSPEAETRLARVPPFIRGFVRQRAEDYARQCGAAAVTVDHLETLARRRFGDTRPAFASRPPQEAP
ncbi:MAG: radical SAM protein [Burkholderiales bacterium]|nr:radical SAM protein [Burkholderiales bacterium]